LQRQIGARYRTGREPTEERMRNASIASVVVLLPLALSAAQPVARQPGTAGGLKRRWTRAQWAFRSIDAPRRRAPRGKAAARVEFRVAPRHVDRPTGQPVGRHYAGPTWGSLGWQQGHRQSGRARRRDGARGDCLAAAEDRIGGRARPLRSGPRGAAPFHVGRFSAAGHLRAPRRGARGPVPGHVRVLGATPPKPVRAKAGARQRP